MTAAIVAISNKLNQRKEREQQQTFDMFTNSVKGITEAQGQVREAQKQMQDAVTRLRKNPQDDDAKQDYIKAGQRYQQATQAMQQNRTNLDDMFNGPKGEKHAKMLSKGFGIDDKNADTPERKLAINAVKKSMGVGDKAAGILSRLPQNQQLTPASQQQAMARQAGVVGAPATQGQVLSSQAAAEKLAQNAAIKTVDQFQKQEQIANKAGQDTSKMVEALPALGMMPIRDEQGNIKRAPDGTIQVRNLTPADVAGNPILAQKLQNERTKNDLMVAQTKATKVRAQVAQMAEERKRVAQSQANDPGQVSNWGRLVTDVSSGVTLKDVPAAARSAVVKWAADSGKQIAKPITTDELKREDLATNALSNIAVAKDILQRRPDMFGPAGWASTKFEKAVEGGDPDAIKFQAAITLANLPAVGIHGVRGQWAIEDLDKLDGNLYLNADSMSNVLNTIERSAGEFAELGGRRAEKTSPQNQGKPVYQDGKLIGHTTDGKTMIPVSN